MKKLYGTLILLVALLFMTACGDERSDDESYNDAVQEHYICVGDSTRAESGYGGQYLFYELYRVFSDNGIEATLLAQAGQTLRGFANDSSYPATNNVIHAIAGSGDGTTVDISLGINDTYSDSQTLKNQLIYAVNKIRKYKPDTTFVLTTPHRLRFNDSHTARLSAAYHQAANALGVGLNSTVDSLNLNATMYLDDGIHLSQKGQHTVAQFLLGNML